MAESFKLSTVFPIKPKAIYDAWLDGKKHGEMIGGTAKASPEVGAKHSAWGNYIKGVNLDLIKNKRILQTWKSTDFPKGSDPSLLLVKLEPVEKGTKVTLHHFEIPDGQGDNYKKGWHEHYFTPMKKYFSSK